MSGSRSRRLGSPLLGFLLWACAGAGPTGEPGAAAERQPREPSSPVSLGGFSDAGVGEERPANANQRPDQPGPGCALDRPLPPEVDGAAGAAALHELGQQRILARDGAVAVAILLAANRQAPDDAEILGDLATALLQCGLHSEAVPRIERAVRLAPTNVDLIANLAQTYQIAGRIPDAIATYRQALEIAPGDAALHSNLAVLLIVTGDLQRAEQQAREATNLAPQQAVFLINLGYILARAQRYPDAEMILKRALDVEPDNPDAHNQMGLVLAAQKRNAEATASFRRALELDPEHRAARENLKAMETGFDFTGPWGD